MVLSVPTQSRAIAIADERLGWIGAKARRFTTGSSFYVYEIIHHSGVAVIRLGLPGQRQVLADGIRLNHALRPLGVPLPQIISEGIDATLPYFIMERLAGSDLGASIDKLSRAQRNAIAVSVADAQLATARLGAGTGYGFAADGTQAQHATWSEVVLASIERARSRIAASDLFPLSIVEPLEMETEIRRDALDKFPPTPFLHDTTTKNVIVAPDGTFSGIIDVDDLCFGDSRFAPALTQAAISAFGGPLDYVQPWLARMGQANDHIFRLYVALFVLGFISEQGMAFNGNPAPSRPEERERLLGIYRSALEAIA